MINLNSKINPQRYMTLIRLFILLILTLFISSCDTAGGKMNKYPAGKFFDDPAMVKLLHNLQRGDEAAARAQLADGLSLNVHGRQNITPLFWLFLNDDKPAARLALKLGADPDYPDGIGRTPVSFFARSIWTDWLEMVLDAGADPNLKSGNGKLPLFTAISGRKPRENIKVLLDHDADINHQNDKGWNSALYAAYVNKFDLVLWLAEQGADVCVYDKALGVSVSELLQDTTELLEERGQPVPPYMLKLKELLIKRGAYPPLSYAEVKKLRAQGKEPGCR